MDQAQLTARSTELQDQIKRVLETRNVLAVQIQNFDTKIMKLQGAVEELQYLIEQEKKSGPESV